MIIHITSSFGGTGMHGMILSRRNITDLGEGDGVDERKQNVLLRRGPIQAGAGVQNQQL